MSQTESQLSIADVTPVRVRVRSDLLDSIQRIARDAAPAEIGWLLFGTCDGDEARIDAVRTLRNTAPNPCEQFAADPIEQMNAYLAASRGGMHCIGNAHSHPRGTARMSKQDRDCAHAGNVLLIVAPDATDGVTARAFWFEPIHATTHMRTLSHEIEVCVEDRT
jgi:proteasome lid subunit RPN8/RPN11